VAAGVAFSVRARALEGRDLHQAIGAGDDQIVRWRLGSVSSHSGADPPGWSDQNHPWARFAVSALKREGDQIQHRMAGIFRPCPRRRDAPL